MGFNYWQNIEEGSVYHIYNKAASNLVLFKDDNDYLFFLAKYFEYFTNYFDTFAYCLIPNHFHLLIRMKTKEEFITSIEKENTKSSIKFINDEIPINNFISDQFRRFLSSIANKYNKKYQHEGSVFVKKLKKVKVSTDGSIQRLLCYIHHNPIHHGLVYDYSQWEYSSYNSYFNNIKYNISKEMILHWLGDISVFEKIHENFKIENSYNDLYLIE